MAKRQARSHAVTMGLENKRKRQQKAGQNFRISSLTNNAGRHESKGRRCQTVVASTCPPPADVHSPFQMFDAKSPTLQALLSHCKILTSALDHPTWLTCDGSDKAQRAAEPTFSVLDELVLQNLRSVFRSGLDDRALLSAVMLTFAFTFTASGISRECLSYQGEALSSIRHSVSSPNTANSESTLWAILLLAGVEVCITFPPRCHIHHACTSIY